MADRNKFEQMLELLVNEDKESAEKLFHEIVVEKSRDIYEGLLEDDKDVDEATDEVEETTEDVFVAKDTGESVRRIVAKMSKSLRNVVNPDDVIAEFGADTFRLYEMYMGPLDASKPW